MSPPRRGGSKLPIARATRSVPNSTSDRESSSRIRFALCSQRTRGSNRNASWRGEGRNPPPVKWRRHRPANLTSVLLEAMQLSLTIGFEESLCFLICRALHCSCVTNDPAFTRYCIAGGVKVLSGLDLLLCLVQRGSLASETASVVAHSMHESNPADVTSDIINRFDDQHLPR